MTDISQIASRLEPDNIHARDAIIYRDFPIEYCISNPGIGVYRRSASVGLGHIESNAYWDCIGGTSIDGSFAIFRADSEHVEILTDATASRTIWYYFDDNLFIASTSQRAIAMVLRSVERNCDAIVWMLSTGTLGPVDAWDKRIKRLPSESSGRLILKSWKLEVTPQGEMPSGDTSENDAKGLLEVAIRESVCRLEGPFTKWALPLSGGYDSRAILLCLPRESRPSAITWGMTSSINDPENDAFIAKQLADAFDLKHQYYEIDKSGDNLQSIFLRFIRCGEARIDQISAYIDGFSVWKRLFESGVEGIIRGDECFGWGEVFSPLDVPSSIGIYSWEEFSNLPPLKYFGFSSVKMPPELHRRDDETIYTWRDRLYRQFRVPVMLAALSDLKLGYVEIANPFLTKRVVRVVRGLSDRDRTNKALFKSVCSGMSPKIPFAKHSATDAEESILKNEKTRGILVASLNSSIATEILGKKLVSFIVKEIDGSHHDIGMLGNRNFRSMIYRWAPPWLSLAVKKRFRTRRMNIDMLAFRAYLVIEMYRLLKEDSSFEAIHRVELGR